MMRYPGPMREPLTRREARRLIGEILATGTVGFSSHALDEPHKDEATTVESTNALRAGVGGSGKWRNGPWRYPVRTARVAVAAAFRANARHAVVAAWRTR